MIRTTRSAALVWVALLPGASASVAPSITGGTSHDAWGASVPDGVHLYVANQGSASISVIDVETLETVDVVDLTTIGFSSNAKPHHIAVEPDGRFWYVSLIGENRVLKFDQDNRLVGEAELEAPGMLALHPTRELLYVGRSMSAVDPPERLGLVDRGDMSVDELDVFFPRPHALAVHPEGTFAFSGSLAANRIASIRTGTGHVELTSVGGDARAMVQFAVSPDGATLIATSQATSAVLIFDVTDPSAPDLRATVDVGPEPWHPVFTPDGRWVYVGNKRANTITVLDPVGAEVAAVIDGYGVAEPHGSAVSPDGRWVFVSSNNLRGDYGSADGSTPGTVVVIDTQARTIVKVIEVGDNAAGLGIRPPA